jgi:hypothetical protein
MPLFNKVIARDEFSDNYINPTSRLRAALEILQQNYDFDIPENLPWANHKTEEDIVFDITTADGKKIHITVPYTGSPLIEISSAELKFDIEAYRKRVAKYFRCS